MTAVPLRRNRDFMLLQFGQLLSNAGTQSTSIAYPLLVLAVTDSAAKTGVVLFARTLPTALLALPAGLAADRWNRKRLMIAANGVRVLAVGGLAATLLLDGIVFWAIPLVAFIEGAGAAFFSAAHAGALRAVVPARQLPAAAGAQTGRQAAVALGGPPLGGALFGLARAAPFVLDAVSYAFSTVSLLLMRTPFQEEREPDLSRLRSRLAEGFRFLWGQPFLRTCALLFGLANFLGPALLLAVVVIGTRQGLSGGRSVCSSPRSAPACCSARSCRRSYAACSPSEPSCCSSCGRGSVARSSSSGRASTCSPPASSPLRSRFRQRTPSCTVTGSR